MSGRDLMAYASIALAVVGLLLFFKYLPRWMGKSKPPSPQVNHDPSAGLAAGMDLQAEMKKTMPGSTTTPTPTAVEASVTAAALGTGLNISSPAQPSSPTGPASAQILVLDKGIQHGPFDVVQVKEMMAGGTFGPDSLCWQPGQAEWQPLRQVFG